MDSDCHMPVFVSPCHGVSSVLASLESHRQRRTVAQKVAPPSLGVGQVCVDFEIVTPAAVCHRGAERPSGPSSRVGDDGDIAIDKSAEVPKPR